MIFNSDVNEEKEVTSSDITVTYEGAHASESSNSTQNISCSGRSFKMPLKDEELKDLSHKNFSPETMKKVSWATRMYKQWRNNRNEMPNLEAILCDLDDKSSITKPALVFALTCFLSKIKKIDGSEYPGKTLYDILICIQFHLETIGFGWKLINDGDFSDIKFTLDNLMKLRVSQGIGIGVKQAQFLNAMDEDVLWNLGLLGQHCPEVLLNTVIFMLGKGCALCAGKEHYALRRPPYNSQFTFMHDDEGQVFLRYCEDIGMKTNRGGIKHRKIKAKQVDVYPAMNPERCPLRVILLYLSKLPKAGTCESFYLQPHKKYNPSSWYQDRPAGVNRLRDCIKDLFFKAGLPGFYTNHSLRSTAATRMYRCNIDEQLIMEITGHRSLSVRSSKGQVIPNVKQQVTACFDLKLIVNLKEKCNFLSILLYN